MASREAVDYRADQNNRERDAQGRFLAGSLAEPLEIRFWRKVDLRGENQCWLWKASQNDGYGQFAVRSGRPVLAHRLAYELVVGPIPEGMTLDHLCRVRHCVNPAHLEIVTLAENKRRGASRSGILYSPVKHCSRGHLLEGENLGRLASGRRKCLACHRIWVRDWRRRDRERRSAA